jgi:hypothetical protein
MADLITLSEFRTAQGVDPTDTRNDDRWEQMITYASDAVLSYTERDFGSVNINETRTFAYDGSGYLDIDDAATITSVVFTYPYGGQTITLDTNDWQARPQRRDDAPVYYYLVLPGYIGGFGSPEMGFTYNLDVYAAEHGNWALPQTVSVTGNWGWPIVPPAVKQAVIWTVQEWFDRPSGESLTSESIEGWSRAWGSRSTGTTAAGLGIPDRARDLLAAYAKIEV